jgi:hypothetical protein
VWVLLHPLMGQQVFEDDPTVIFSAPSTVGADTIQVDPGDGLGNTLTINPADGAVDPSTGTATYTYGPGVRTYNPIFYAVNSAGVGQDTVQVNVIPVPTDPDTGGGAGVTATATPRDIWVIPGNAAYRAGDLVDNELYLALGLNVPSDVPTLVDGPNGAHYCVNAGPAGPTPESGGGGGNDPGDQEPFTDVFDDTF